VNSGHATWREVAVETARLLGLEPRLDPVTMSELRLKAPRPRFCALANRKLAAAGFDMPAWQDAVARWIAGRLVTRDS
jgi:dTDP-4-dehydrorhamnose reductase